MNELTNIELNEISLVAEGANPEAKILLFKSKTGTKNSTFPIPHSTLELELRELRELTNSLKESVTKAQAKQEIEQLRKYEVLGTPAEKLQSMLAKAKAVSPEIYRTTLAALDESLTVLEKSKAFSEIGTSKSSGIPADVEQLSKSIQKKNPTLSQREAWDRAFLELGR